MNILFICKYNRFRSKVAEAFFNKYNTNKKIRAKSAGIIRGSYPLDKDEARVAKEFGIKPKGRPQGLSTELLKWQNMAIIVANDVPPEIMEENKKYGKKLIVWQIPDWDGKDDRVVRKIITEIEKKVKLLVEEIK